MSYVRRTMDYNEVNWFTDDHMNFESLVREVWENTTTQNERSITLNDGTCIMAINKRDYKMLGGGFAIHFARFVDKQAVGVIDMSPIEVSVVTSQLPENNKNFLENGFAAMVMDNNVIIHSASQNGKQFVLFFQDMFEKTLSAKYESENLTKFALAARGDIDRLKEISAIGVKSVSLDMTISDVDAKYISDSDEYQKNIKAPLLTSLMSIFLKDKPRDATAPSGGKLKVSISVSDKDLTATKIYLSDFAKNVVNWSEDDDYTIILNNDEKISLRDVKLRKPVNIPRQANTFNIDRAWEQMKIYFQELIEKGYLNNNET